MKAMKRCKCGAAAIAVFILCSLVGYINGHHLGNWTTSTWIAAIFIALAAGICLRCRQKEDEIDAQKQLQKSL